MKSNIDLLKDAVAAEVLDYTYITELLSSANTKVFENEGILTAACSKKDIKLVELLLADGREYYETKEVLEYAAKNNKIHRVVFEAMCKWSDQAKVTKIMEEYRPSAHYIWYALHERYLNDDPAVELLSSIKEQVFDPIFKFTGLLSYFDVLDLKDKDESKKHEKMELHCCLASILPLEVASKLVNLVIFQTHPVCVLAPTPVVKMTCTDRNVTLKTGKQLPIVFSNKSIKFIKLLEGARDNVQDKILF